MSIRTLASLLAERMEARGLNQTDLATRAEIPKATLNNIMKHRIDLPDLTTLVKLSTTLEVPLRTLLDALEIHVESMPEKTALQERISTYLDAAPRMQAGVLEIMELDPEDQDSMLTYLEFLRSRRQGGESGERQ